MLYIDVSHHDWNRNGGNLDWRRIKAEGGVDPVVCIRATYGDPEVYAPATLHFGQMAAAAKAEGFYVGGYHNLIHSPDDAGILRQVKFFKAALDAADAKWAMLDVEPYEALKQNGLWPRFSDVEKFIAAWKQLDGRPLMIYLARWVYDWIQQATGQSSKIDRLDGELVSARYPLGTRSGFARDLYALISNSASAGSGFIPYGGKTPKVWQFTASAKIPGASSSTDVNFFPGTVDQFKALTEANMPTDAQLRSEAVFNAEYVSPEMQVAMNEIRVGLGLPWANMGAKGDRFHLNGGHRSQRWILTSRYCTNRTYTVTPGLASANLDLIAAIDITAANDAQMLTISRRIDAAARAGLIEEVIEWYGNVDGDTIVDGWNNIENRIARSDSSHLWHLHITIARWALRSKAVMDKIVAVLLGRPIPGTQPPAATPVDEEDEMKGVVLFKNDGTAEWALCVPGLKPVRTNVQDLGTIWVIQHHPEGARNAVNYGADAAAYERQLTEFSEASNA